MPPGGRGGGGRGGGGSFHEEDALGKVYDGKLVSRLLKYAKPYAIIIILAIGILIFLSGSRIYKPYLMKEAIDDAIVLQYLMLDLSLLEKPYKDDFINRYSSKILYLDSQSKCLVKNRDIDPKDLAQLRKYNSITKDRFLLVDKGKFSTKDWAKAQSVIKGRPDLFISIQGNDSYSISQKDLAQLSTRENFYLKLPLWDILKHITFIYVIILAAGFILEFIQFYLIALIGQKVMHDIRTELFSHLTRLSLKYFDNHPIGRLVTRVTNDVGTLNEMFTSVLINIASDIFLLIGITVTIFLLNWRLALTLTLILPIIILATILFKIRFRKAYREVRIQLARINATLSEHFSGIRVIKIFARERENFKRFDTINQGYFKATIRMLTVDALFSPVIVIANNIGLALIIWYGGGLVIQDIIPLGTLVAFLTYIQMFYQPINAIAEKYNIMQSAMAASERIFQIMDEPDEMTGSGVLKSLPIETKGRVEFKNVWFAYKEEDWVLKDVSFFVEPAETIAIVGATGAGKTTIISLLMRFYEPLKGEILLDGIDIRTIDKAVLRSMLGLVLQDVFLFTGDIKGNIRLNNEEITDKTIKDSAVYVNADGFISRLDAGYDAEVTERGSTLSMGQRQLLAFARALAFDPRILILDEATSSIDTETEQLIQDALIKLMKGRTSIVIAHRLSTIQHASKILVMHKGQVFEEGDHQGLLAKRGIYYKLYELQYKGLSSKEAT